jgi:hypothetical protein
VLERATKEAAQWQDARHHESVGSIQKMELHPREAESIAIVTEAMSGRPAVVIRLANDAQFPFLIDDKWPTSLVRFSAPRRVMRWIRIYTRQTNLPLSQSLRPRAFVAPFR